MAETFVLLHGSWHGGWAWEPTAWCLRELGLPKSYVAVAEDRALPEGTWHPGMSSRLGPCKIVQIAGSHEVMFTRPAELARTLTEAAHD